MAINEHEADCTDYNEHYIIWQNRATDFYISSRCLCLKKPVDIYRAALFCGYQAIESLLKATLIYWDRSFNPKNANHNFPKMIKIMKNKVPNSNNINIPQFFFDGSFFQEVTRYPNGNKPFIPIPNTFRDDLDKVFCDLVYLVPFQFNSELRNAVVGHYQTDLNSLRRKNGQIRGLRKFLNEH